MHDTIDTIDDSAEFLFMDTIGDQIVPSTNIWVMQVRIIFIFINFDHLYNTFKQNIYSVIHKSQPSTNRNNKKIQTRSFIA